MSESSSELGAAGRKRSVDELVERLRAKTLAERLPLLAHLSIGRALCKLRDAIVTNDEPVSARSAKTLLCCGIAMYRRHAVGEKTDEEGEVRTVAATPARLHTSMPSLPARSTKMSTQLRLSSAVVSA